MTTRDATELISEIENLIDCVHGASDSKIEEISIQVNKLIGQLPPRYKYAGLGYGSALMNAIMEEKHPKLG